MTASRSIANAHEQHPGAPADAARAEAERLREARLGAGLTRPVPPGATAIIGHRNGPSKPRALSGAASVVAVAVAFYGS